jgi:hypothetical protein
MNEAPDLPLTIGLMVMEELVKNNELGCKVAAEGFEGPALDPLTKGQNAEQQGSQFLLREVWGEWL